MWNLCIRIKLEFSFATHCGPFFPRYAGNTDETEKKKKKKIDGLKKTTLHKLIRTAETIRQTAFRQTNPRGPPFFSLKCS